MLVRSEQQAKSLAAALLYGFTGIAMIFVNKMVLSVYGFGAPTVLLLAQMGATVSTLEALRRGAVVRVQRITWSRAKALMPVTVLYQMNVCFALSSLERTTLPMYSALKRSTPAVVLLVDRARGKKQRPQVVASVLLTVSGCILAGYTDLHWDARGYLSGLTSCLLQALYLVSVERTGVEKGLSSIDLLLYNSLLSFPALLVITLADGEMAAAPAKLRLSQDALGLWASFSTAAFLGSLLNFAVFACTQLNSALTTTIVGVMRGVITTAVGFFAFGGVTLGSVPVLGGSFRIYPQLIGIFINVLGGCWYSWLKADPGKPPSSSSSSNGGQINNHNPPSSSSSSSAAKH